MRFWEFCNQFYNSFSNPNNHGSDLTLIPEFSLFSRNVFLWFHKYFGWNSSKCSCGLWRNKFFFPLPSQWYWRRSAILIRAHLNQGLETSSESIFFARSGILVMENVLNCKIGCSIVLVTGVSEIIGGLLTGFRRENSFEYIFEYFYHSCRVCCLISNRSLCLDMSD